MKKRIGLYFMILFLFFLISLECEGKGKRIKFKVDSVEFSMILVKGGTFDMGATLEQIFPFDNELPVHKVRLSDYYIGETEVTQELWNAVTGTPLSHFKGDAQLPVEDVTWYECLAFIQLLQQKTAMKFCLPTEAQWEYAARGGQFSRGYQYSGSDDIEEVAWYGASACSIPNACIGTISLGSYVDPVCAHTYPVAQKRSNELGIYDMSGNVAEWTADFYAPYTNESKKNPKGPAYGTDRVFRGGCWYFGEWVSRVSQRQGVPPSTHYSNLGFRLALPKFYKM